MDDGIFNVRINLNACDCTRSCTDTPKRVCTERWLGEKSLAAQGSRTCVSGVPIWRCTNWATFPAQGLATPAPYWRSWSFTMCCCLLIIITWSILSSFVWKKNYHDFTFVFIELIIRKNTLVWSVSGIKTKQKATTNKQQKNKTNKKTANKGHRDVKYLYLEDTIGEEDIIKGSKF